MKIKKIALTKLIVFQFLTLISLILLIPIYYRWVENGYELIFTMVFAIMVFFPNFIGHLYRLPYQEVKHNTVAYLVVMWMYSLFNIGRIIEIAYEKDLGIFVYVMGLIPVIILILYLTYSKEWKNFYKSLLRKRS